MPDDLMADLRSVDPIRERPVNRGLLAEARPGLIDEIVAFEPIPGAAPSGKARRRSWILRPALALSVIALVAIGIVLSGRGSDPEERSAYAAPLVEFAKSTPLVLLESPGFSVTYVDGDESYGTMIFEKEQESGPPISAELNWYVKPSIDARARDWGYDSRRLRPDPPVLGTRAWVFDKSLRDGRHDLLALWRLDGRTLEIRSMVPDVRYFMEMLAALEQVDVKTWLDAMPPSVIRSADPTDELGKMLQGVPLPPGFDPSRIRIPGLAQDRYQFGATVVGAVTCAWFAYWTKARRDGDEVAEREAVEAMATSRDWSVLKEMRKTGAYPRVIWGFAEAMPSGKWAGRPLEGDVNTGLGCPSMGIDITNERNQ